MSVNRSSLPEGLLADVKNYCDKSWADQLMDAKISGLIASGMIYLNGKLGAEADYTADGAPRTLLMDYVRYGLSDALDVFESNFASQIIAMQNERRVSIDDTLPTGK